MASEQLKRYLSKYDYEDSIENLTIGYMFGISPDEARGIDYCDLSDEDSTFYDDVYRAIEKELYGDNIEESCGDAKKEKKVTEGLTDYFTEYGKKRIDDAKSLGLFGFYDEFSGVFEFTIEELKANKDSIKKWLELYPEDALNKIDASDYDTETSDGYLYFMDNPEDFDIPEDKLIDIDSINESVNNNRNKSVLKEAITSYDDEKQNMNYENEMFQFICDYIDNNVDVNSEEYLNCDTIGEFEEKVVSELWEIVDSSKGQKLSGDKAKKKIFGSTKNLEALRQAVEYFDFESKFGEKFVNEDYGWMDTVIRLYFVDNLTSDALEEKISFDKDGNLS